MKAPRAHEAEPTLQDRENAQKRLEIAERQNEQYDECLRWALQLFGRGWEPSGRHYLVDKDEETRARHSGESPRAAATVYTVRNDAGDKRHFTVTGGQAAECESYEAAFGEMLLEPHATNGFEHKGQFCRTHRYSLCWAGYERYAPRSAEQLASLRVAREKKKVERELKEWQEENPLFAMAGLGPGNAE